MAKLVVMVHTVAPLVSVFDRLGAAVLPDVRRLHILDEPLLERIRRRGSLAGEDAERLRAHVAAAREAGADVVLVTCSTISPCVDAPGAAAGIPVIKIDEAMVEAAVNRGGRVGVVATNVTTLEPTRLALAEQATRTGRTVDVQAVLVEGALAALMGGDVSTHDRLVKAALLELMAEVDIIILAQASTARVLDVLPEDARRVPVLSSPHLALARVRAVLEHAPRQPSLR